MRLRARSIISKSRICIIGLIVLIFASVLGEWRELSRVREGVFGVSARATPVLTTIGDLTRLGHDLRSTADGIPHIRTQAGLVALQERAMRIIGDIEDLMAQADLPGGLPDRAEADLRDLTDAQARVLRAEAMIDARLIQVHAALDEMVRLLLPSYERDTLALLRPSGDVPDPAARRALIEKAVLTSELKANVMHLSLLAGGFKALRTDEGSATRARFLAQIGNFASRMSRLRDDALQLAVAGELARYRNATIGDEGLVAAEIMRRTAERDRTRAIAAASSLVTRVTRDLGEASLTAATAFETSARMTALSLRRVLLLKLALTAILVFAASAFLWMFIQKGILNRLSRIAAHVRRMNAGDLSGPLKISGADEIGDIEAAIDRSRRMATTLRRTNEELERFAYVAAHDLRSPLRAVADLVTWTREDHGEALPAGARGNLDLIEGRVRRLSDHLSGLLDYARAGQTEEGEAMFDLASFVEELRAVFIASENHEIILRDAPAPFLTRPVPLRTILLNLVSNAIKHHDRDHGQIVISCTVKESKLSITVTDDGPGIEQAYHERIFILFQTLRTRDDVEASGLGLAMVRKLAATLDGTIDVVSDPGTARGTSFVLHIPLRATGSQDLTHAPDRAPDNDGDLAA